MNDRRFLVPFLNLGHLLDHLVMLVFPTVVIALAREWNQPYSEMLPLALGGFIAFGAFAIPAGWLADHWSRYRMMVVRSEEHTSELQSRFDLVCRLLLEKKKYPYGRFQVFSIQFNDRRRELIN